MPHRKAILVADDSVLDVEILERAFYDAGIKAPFIVTRDGEEAIHYLAGEDEYQNRAKHPFPRLLLLDLKMPKLDGFDVLRWLQNQPALRRLIVTVLSSSDEPKDIDRAYDLGANSYLVKPSRTEGFREIAEKVHGYWLELNRPGNCANHH